MDKVFVFDVDGTLTPSRGIMDTKFAETFVDIASRHPMYMVTGSDRPKTIEQVGESVYNSCRAVYQCSGNEKWYQDTCLRTTEIELPDDMYKVFDYWLGASQFKHKTGQHVDIRSGLVNYSIVGRGATPAQRAEYVQWDNSIDERRTIAATMNNAFGDRYSITVAGETGIDITYLGSGKQQIVDELLELHPGCSIEFYGDKTEPGGNDYTIAKKLLETGHTVYPVEDWMDTEYLLLRQDL